MRRKSPVSMGLNEKSEGPEAGVGTKPSARVLMESSLTIAAFLALNATLNMTNRWVLGVYGFKCVPNCVYMVLNVLCWMDNDNTWPAAIAVRSSCSFFAGFQSF